MAARGYMPHDGATRQTNRCQSGRVILSIFMMRLAPVRPFSAVKFSIARKNGSPRNAWEVRLE